MLVYAASFVSFEFVRFFRSALIQLVSRSFVFCCFLFLFFVIDIGPGSLITCLIRKFYGACTNGQQMVIAFNMQPALN